jgi:transposase InsO family protein
LKVITLTEQWLEVLMAPARHGLTVTETCRRYGISRQTFYEYRARYRDHGLEGLQPRSRRPLTCKHQIPPEVEDLIVAVRKERPRWGARKIRTVLQRRGSPTVPAVSTVHQILVRNGLVGVQPRRRRLAWKRFERPVPNDLWQIDATQVLLADRSKAWVIDVVDDHARFAIAAHACRSATTTAAWRTVEQAIAEHGAPRQLISDNGLSFTGRRHGRTVRFERQLKALGVQQLTAKPRHPQTCGKLERYHRTFKEYYADHGPADSIESLQQLLDAFRWDYNVHRPHQSLAYATPQDTYTASAKAAPLTGHDQAGKPVPPRTLRANPNGSINYRKRKINVGKEKAGKPIHATEDRGIVRLYDGHEFIREVLLGPPGTYHGSGKKPTGRPPKKKIE